MGARNFLVEGVSASGKTSVCHELRQRGFHALNGDRDLAYQGDPLTGEPTATASHEHHLWHEQRVRALAADRSQPVTFFCGGSRNVHAFLEVFDEVFLLEIDAETLGRRLDGRPADEFGADPAERALVLRLHETRDDLPPGTPIDATRPLGQVVDEIVRQAQAHDPLDDGI